MGRLKIQLPDQFDFSTEIPLRITDLNYGGHLGNDVALALLHEARVRFLRYHGFTEHDIGGAGILMADAALVYKSEGFYGDTLQVEVGTMDFTRVGCDVVYRVSRKKDGREIVHAKTGIVGYDYERKRVVRLPGVFLRAMGAEAPVA